MGNQCRTVINEIAALRHKEDRVYISDLSRLERKYKKNHNLALDLWQSGNINARELAVRIADPHAATDELLEMWLKDIEDWGLCDAFTAHLVRQTTFAQDKVYEWPEREEPFQRRAGFSLIAQIAWMKNDVPDRFFLDFLPVIEKHACDDRYYVKKAVNWALRDIGKRNAVLRVHALALSERLQENENKTARWVGKHRIGEVAEA